MKKDKWYRVSRGDTKPEEVDVTGTTNYSVVIGKGRGPGSRDYISSHMRLYTTDQNKAWLKLIEWAKSDVYIMEQSYERAKAHEQTVRDNREAWAKELPDEKR